MKKIISILALLALLANVVILSGCLGDGNEPEPDDNFDPGIQDPSDDDDDSLEEDDPELPGLKLVENGVAKFNIVYSSSLGTEASKALVSWANLLKDKGVTVKRVADYRPGDMQDCEILVGSSLKNRENWSLDEHGYGEKGYHISEKDGKVVIYGGSDEAMVTAINLFFESYFTSAEDGTINNVSIAEGVVLEKKQDDYLIDDVTVGGESVKGKLIYANSHDGYSGILAQSLQAALYTYAGIWADITYEEDAPCAIRISSSSSCSKNGFDVKLDTDGALSVTCAYMNCFESAFMEFLDSVIINGSGTIEFDSDYLYTKCVSVVTYDDFGAVGDGVTDDFLAIKAAHDFANAGGQTVEATSGKTYYIGHNLATVLVKTDVDWKDARFIIDDSKIPTTERGFWLFKAVSDYSAKHVTVPEGFTLKKGQKNIGLTFSEPKLLKLICEDEMVYIRYGANSNTGYAKQEVILVDEEGNVDPSTPIIWDYGSLSSITSYCVTDKPITLSGGIFTTIANREISASKYYARGLRIERSNTTVYGVTHYITGEPTTKDGSCPYTGFYSADQANNVTFEKCVMTAHKTYTTTQPDGDKVTQGNYDTQPTRCTNISWIDCTQSNAIDTYPTTWGVMASNFCKNLSFDGCVLSRFDAHMGVHNVRLVDTTIGEVINLVGSGTAYFENVTLSSGFNNYFIRLREDYGSTWEGTVVIKDCTLVIRDDWNSAFVLRADWKNHWFGYTCYLPNIDIDGFTLVRKNGSAYNGNVYLLKNIATSYSGDLRSDAKNPIVAPEYITIKNMPYSIDYVQGTNNDVILTDTVIKKED